MEVKRIELVNFGPFYGDHLYETDVQPNRPLVLIRALNDVVKTSFLKSFRFCLYGTHQQYGVGTGEELNKVPNRKAALEADGESSVLFAIEHDGDHYEIKRTAHFKKVKEFADPPEIVKWEYQIKKNGSMIIDPTNGMGHQNDFDDMIEKWLPRDISPFYFFDVEESKQYASKKPSPSIIGSIMKILNIKQNTNAKEDLEKVSRKLNKALNDAQSQVSTTKDEAEKLQERRVKLDQEKQSLNVIKEEVKNLRTSMSKLQQWLEEHSGEGEDWKKYNALTIERGNNDLALKSMTDQMKSFHDTRLLSEIIQLSVKPANLTAASNYSIHEISVAKTTLDEDLKKCSICDSDITDSSIAHLKSISGIVPSEDSAKQQMLRDISTVCPPSLIDSEHLPLLEQQLKLSDDIESTDSALKAVEDKLSSSATTAAEEEHRQKQSKFDKQRGMVISMQNDYEQRKDENDRQFTQLTADVRQNSANSDDERVVVAQARVNLCQQAMDSYDEIIKTVVETEKAKIIEYMSDTFTKITNKPDLYTALSLDDDYRIQIKIMDHNYKPAWIIGPSSGQSAMIALAFISALTSRSVGESPVVLDSPSGKLDPPHRRNIIKFWPKLAKQGKNNGQVFVLYQPNELNEKQYKGIEEYVSHHFRGIKKPGAADESVLIPFDGDWEEDA